MKKYNNFRHELSPPVKSRVEKAVNALPDVDSAVVSLLTNSMQVEAPPATVK